MDAPPRPARSVWLYLMVGLIGASSAASPGSAGGGPDPLMVGLLGVSQHQAHGTSLAIIVPTAVVAGTQYFVAPAGPLRPSTWPWPTPSRRYRGRPSAPA